MSSKQYRAIETPVGIVKGRDAIYLDSFEFELHGALTLKGVLNGNLVSKPVSGARFLAYTLSFYGVLALRVIELDSWDYQSASSFDEVEDSEWIAKLGGKVNSAHKHFLVQTYDHVIEVAGEKYELAIS